MDAPPIQYARAEDGTNLAYWTLGAGEAVIPLYSAHFSHIQAEWDVPAISRFHLALAQSFEVIRFDPRCAGLSDEAEDFSLEAQAGDLQVIRSAAGARRVALISCGAGAAFATAFATHHPHLVSSVVILAPAVRFESVASWTSPLADALPREYFETQERLADPEREDPPGTLAQYLAGTMPLERQKWALEQGLLWDVPGLLPQVQVPTMVVHWDEGRFWDAGPEVASRIDGARLVVRHGRGHPWYDPDPDSLIALIRDFVLEHVDQLTTSSAAIASNEPADAIPLSPREREAVALVAAAKTNAEIAKALVISSGTVARHVSNMLAKTGLKNRLQLATYAVEHGLTNPDL